MKGLTPEQFINIQSFIQRYHRFAGHITDTEYLELRKTYPRIDRYGFNIKYIDSIYDSRLGDFWSVSFRGMGNNLCFQTNTSLKVPFHTLHDWLKAYLTGEWKPSKSEYKELQIKND